jgi:hypothetical protein
MSAMRGASTVGDDNRAVADRAVHDTRTFERVFAAILMPIGPLAVAVIRFVIPLGPVGESVAEQPDAQRLVLAFGVIAVFTLIPGAFAALHLTRRYRPVFTVFVGATLVPGYLAMTVLMAGDTVAMAATDLGLPPEVVTRLSDALMSLPSVLMLVLVFIVGHIVGTVLLGILVTTARLVPLAVGVLLTVSQPIHLAAVIVASHELDLLGWGLTAIGMGFLALRVLRTPNDEWELPPLDRR